MIRWLGKGFWAVTDQGLFAASNFVLNILLARWLAPQDYGAFVVAYAVFSLVGVVHNALLSEPMLVFGAGRYQAHLPEYLGVLLYGHSAFSVLCGLLLLSGALAIRLLGSQGLFLAFLGLAGTVPFVLLQVLMRQACYVSFKPYLAALGSGLYAMLMLAGAYILFQEGWLSALTAFGLMGGAGLVVGLFLASILHAKLFSPGDGTLIRRSLASHLDYGRWAVGARVVDWVAGNSYFVLLPIASGLEAAAALRALTNLIMPVIQTYSALTVLLLPTLVQARNEARFGRIARWALGFFVFGSTLYWIVLSLLHNPLIDWLYGGRYTDYAGLIWFLALVPILVGVAAVQSTVLRALERVDLVFWASVVSTVVALTAGLGALFALGVSGVVVWLLLSWTAAVLTMWWFISARAKGSPE